MPASGSPFDFSLSMIFFVYAFQCSSAAATLILSHSSPIASGRPCLVRPPVGTATKRSAFQRLAGSSHLSVRSDSSKFSVMSRTSFISTQTGVSPRETKSTTAAVFACQRGIFGSEFVTALNVFSR